jgi:MtN3 and saliva related transmembrane protein
MNFLLPGLNSLRSYTEAIGSCAAVLTTAAFAPQVIRTWRTGGGGLSWLMLCMLGSGVWLWFLYGLLRASIPIVAANGLTGLQILFLAGLKAWHAHRPQAKRSAFAASARPNAQR